MVNTIKFSQFAAVDLTTNTKQMVGISASSGGQNIQSPFTITWTTATRPSPPYDGLLGYNTDIKEYEYWDASTSAWTQIIASDVVNATYILQVPSTFLPNAQSLSALTTGILKSTTATGVISISAPLTSIDGLSIANHDLIYATGTASYGVIAAANSSVLVTSSGGVPSLSTTLPSGLTISNPNINEIFDTNGNPILLLSPAASAVNYLSISNSATNTNLILSALGSDSSIGISIAPKNGVLDIIDLTNTVAPAIRFYNAAINHYTGLKAATTQSTSVTFVLPALDGSANYVMQTDGSGNLSLAALSASVITGIVAPINGGTGVASPTAHGIMIAEGASAMTPIVLTAGQVLIGTTSGDPAGAAINSGTGILVGNASGSITVGLAAIASHDILSNITGGSAAPIANTLTATIDAAIGSTQGDILYRNSTVWTVLAPSTAGYVLTTGGAAANPSWAAITATGAITTIDGDSGSASPSSGVVTISGGTTGLTTSGSSSTLSLTGTLKLANGGTNASLTASNGGIFYSTASAGAILAGTATANQVLLSGSSTTPAWSTATYPATTTINQLLFSSSNNVIAGLATATTAVLTTSSGVPTWASELSLALGGTNAALTASNGGIFYSTATAGAILAGTATAGQLLTSGASTTPAWTTSTYPATNAVNTLLYASSANVMAALATANSSILVTSSGGAPSWSTTLPAFTTSSITFSPTTGGIVGTTTNDNAAAGKVGEFVSSVIPNVSAVSLTTATAKDVTSISLTAGDWDVFGNVNMVDDAGLGVSGLAWVSLSSATQPDSSLVAGVYGVASYLVIAPTTPYFRASLSTTTTVYLSCIATFGSGNGSARGGIYARRVR